MEITPLRIYGRPSYADALVLVALLNDSSVPFRPICYVELNGSYLVAVIEI